MHSDGAGEAGRENRGAKRMSIEIDHISLGVSDYEAAKKFYTAALKPLRIGMVMEYGDAAGLGADGKPFLWIAAGGKTTPHVHIAFRAENRGQVDKFYEAAMAAGATDNGPPGLRPHYHQTYYAAFILDPDGHNIEAVCHTPPAAAAAKKPPARKAASRKKPARSSAAKKPTRKAPAKRPASKKRPASRRKVK
jgi:catechol 2,3-dioxygenase-like lactoylglutathione lyase family enzyme